MDGAPTAVQAALRILPRRSSLDKAVPARGEKKKLFCCSFSDLALVPSFSFLTHRWFPSVASLSRSVSFSLHALVASASYKGRKIFGGPSCLFRPALFSLDKEVASLFWLLGLPAITGLNDSLALALRSGWPHFFTPVPLGAPVATPHLLFIFAVDGFFY
jgi:hypothetical protein